MDWKEIVLSALRNNEDLEPALERAARIAPKEVPLVLRNFPGNIEETAEKLHELPKAISLLFFHFFIANGENFGIFPLDKQRSILLASIRASSMASSVAADIGEKKLEALYSFTAGNSFYQLRRFSEAEKAYTEALEKFRILEKENPEAYTSNIAKVLNGIGNLCMDTKRFHEAEIVYIEALEKYRTFVEKSPDKYTIDMIFVLNNLGNLFREMKKFSQAEKAYIEALQKYGILTEKNPEIYTFEAARTFNNFGNLYVDTRRFSEAEKAYLEALQKYRVLTEKNPEIYTDEIVLTLNNIGNLYNEMKKFIEAEKSYNEALEKCRILVDKNPEVYTPDLAMILKNVGFLYCQTGRLSEAERAYAEALDEYRVLAERYPWTYTVDIASTLNSIGILCRNTERFSQAEKVCTEALEKYSRAKLWFEMASCIHNISRIRNNREILEESRKTLELAILFLKEEKYRYAYKGNYEYIYLDSLERSIDTFGVLEALRDPQLLSLSWCQVLLQEEIIKSQSDVEFQKSLLERIQGEHVPQHEPMELPENSLFIYIQRIRDHFSFFVVESETAKEFTCGRDFFSLGMKLLYLLKFQQIASKSSHCRTYVEKFETLSRQWFELLPSELRMLIQERDSIAFSPDQSCSFLPLEALQSDDQPLCVKRNVVRATSLHQFSTLLTRKRCFGSSLIVGNPWPACKEKELVYSLTEENFSRHSMFFLEGAEMEARILMKQLPKPTLLLRQEATGERFMKEISGHSLIHFSGHGSLGRILFLSGPFKGFPPLFEAEEFLDLRKTERTRGTKRINMMEEWHPVTDLDLFDTRLVDGAIVFLNACETGKHKYAGGGYYQGLPAVFLKNGAHSVVSSLAPISDEPSKEFAVHFYRNLLNSHTVADSMKAARVQMENKYEAQVHWIPYVHYGSPF